MPILERASKTAATSSVLLILRLVLAVHPDMTWLLRALSVAAFVAGWSSPRRRRAHSFTSGCSSRRLAPAFLRLLAGREGPVLDIVWMAGLAGGLLRVTPWSRWTMPMRRGMC